ncbi:MAG: hypothetical protein KA289_03380 [Kaistella sp.]|nr:hypothetical protein [Kaistella sp.]
MKTYFTIFLLVALNFTTLLSAQVYKFKSTSYALQKEDELEDFPKFMEDNSLIVLNIEKRQIRIYGKEELVFDLIAGQKSMKLTNGDTKQEYTGIDSDGLKCKLTFFTIVAKNSLRNYDRQLYIDYSNARIILNLNLVQ